MFSSTFFCTFYNIEHWLVHLIRKDFYMMCPYCKPNSRGYTVRCLKLWALVKVSIYHVENVIFWHKLLEFDPTELLKPSKVIKAVIAIKFSLSCWVFFVFFFVLKHTFRFMAVCFIQNFKTKTATSLSITAVAAVQESRQGFFCFYWEQERNVPYDIQIKRKKKMKQGDTTKC